MRGIYDTSQVRRILRDGIEKGLWTMEDLDQPTEGFVRCTKVDRQTFMGGYEGVQHRNLLRPDPANPHPEAVEASPSPRDLPPTPTESPIF